MRQLKAEFYKMRHTFLFPLHVIVPVAAGVLFLAWTRISAQLQFSVLCRQWELFFGTGICDLRRKHRAGVIRSSAGISYDYGKKRKHFSGKMDEP